MLMNAFVFHAPEGYTFTGEYRKPVYSEFFLIGNSRVDLSVGKETAPYLILRKLPSVKDILISLKKLNCIKENDSIKELIDEALTQV